MAKFPIHAPFFLIFVLRPPKMLITSTVTRLEDELDAPEAALGDPPSGSFSMRWLLGAS